MFWEKLLRSCISRTGIIIIWCNILDLLSTFYALTFLNGQEANPLANYFLMMGWAHALVFKGIGTILVCYLVYEISEIWPKHYIYVVWFLVLMYLLIFVNNIGVFIWLTV